MDTVIVEERRLSELWWVPLIVGVAWMILALAVLQFDVTSVNTIAILTGLVLLGAGITEVAEAAWSPVRRWLHASLAVVCLAAGVAALVWPDPTFHVVARLFSWYLLLKGLVDILTAFWARDERGSWVLLLLVGALEVALAFWASGYQGRAATLLLLWVGIGALARGVAAIVFAFRLRALGAEAQAAELGEGGRRPERVPSQR